MIINECDSLFAELVDRVPLSLHVTVFESCSALAEEPIKRYRDSQILMDERLQ